MFLFRFIWKIIKAVLLFIVLLVVGIAIFFINLPNISWLKNHNPQTTRFMEIYLSELEAKGAEAVLDHHWKKNSQISSSLKKAVLISEDDAFFYHHGFDWTQIREAIKRNWRDKAFTRGGSTITQQLVKNLYLGPEKNLFRKLREWILTFQMEKTLKKERIFEIYLNVIEWGPGVYGAEAASRYYFGKGAESLAPSEAAYLAVLLPNPKKYGTKKYSKKANRKASLILKRMHVPLAEKETNELPPPEQEKEELPSMEKNGEDFLPFDY